MIGQLNIGGNDKVETAIKRLQTFEPSEGYFMAFSGGKDSVVIKALADMAAVKYDAHYHITSVDPPELVRFIKEQYSGVIFDYPRDKNGEIITMWNLIPRRNLPPTRRMRYCCQELKEGGGNGRFVVTGVRWAESARRAQNRGGLEINHGKKERFISDPDNPENERLAHFCPTKGKNILNPIIDWSTAEVWEFIKTYDVPYCSLYDEGFKRLGCIGCPMGSTSQRLNQFKRWPKYKDAYMRAFARMIEEDKLKGVPLRSLDTPERVFNWWIEADIERSTKDER